MPTRNRTGGRAVLPWTTVAAGLLALLAWTWPASAETAKVQERAKPNFIVILIDDLGYRDVGVYGAKDILPTCVAAAGGKLPADREYDGADLRGYLAGKAGDWTGRPMFWRVWRDRAVRMGKWKLVWTGDALPRLYDLSADIEEEKDLAAQRPDTVGSMKEAWKTWNKKNIAPLFQFEMKGGRLM